MNRIDCLKYKYSTFKKDVDLPASILVAVAVDDKFCRGSVTMQISPNRYQVFLIDYGVSHDVHLDRLFLLPSEYCTKFKQQCFMCQLKGVSINSESNSRLFAEWFHKKVNKNILHAKIVDTDDDGINYVELYDFIHDSTSASINSMVPREWKI